jgi:adenylate cyclase
MTTTRRLAAVLAADVAGYSRLMSTDEVGTLAALKAARREVVDPAIAEHNGRIVKTTGDGMLVEFASAVDAVTCAMAVQEKMAARGGNLSFRIGINVGDIIIDGDDIFGDGVNVAARVEGECQPGGVCLSAQALDQVRNKTTFTFDDLGEKALKNIDRPVRIYAVSIAGAVATSITLPEPSKPLPLPDKASIAVLPFQNMSGDPEQEYFADGLVEEIITALSRFKSLFVVARNSSFTFKGKAVDIKQIGRELGVRYVLEGSVRKAAGRVRITGQLIEAATGAHLWADKFEGTLEDVFELQDRVTASVVGPILPRVTLAEIERTKTKPTESLDAYDTYLRGAACHQRGELRKALAFYREAASKDPDYARAFAQVANCLRELQCVRGVPLDPEEKIAAVEAARRAAELGRDDPHCLASAGHAFVYFGVDHDRGTGLVEHATALNPNLVIAWALRGWMCVVNGDAASAIDNFNSVIRISPLDPTRIYAWNGIAWAHFGLGNFEEGCEWATRALQHGSNAILLSAFIANAVHAGRLEDAGKAALKLKEIAPGFRAAHARDAFPMRRPDTQEKIRAALVRAGLPE